jgi:hypothetical protein
LAFRWRRLEYAPQPSKTSSINKQRHHDQSACYEARKFGVRSAMPSVTAKRQCPDLIFVKPRFEVYKAVSQQIREIFAEHTPIIEPLSLDEAYLDVTENLGIRETGCECRGGWRKP